MLSAEPKKILTVGLASDHAGYKLKAHLYEFLQARADFSLLDLGCSSADQPTDYPDDAQRLATSIETKQIDFGILVCGSGIGVNIVANRNPSVRAALCRDVLSAHLARAKNNANVLCLGALFVTPYLGELMVEEFLVTTFEGGGRHGRRVSMFSPQSD